MAQYYVRAIPREPDANLIDRGLVDGPTPVFALERVTGPHGALLKEAGVWPSERHFIAGAKPLAVWLTIEKAAALGATIALRPGATGGVVLDG